MQKRVLVPLDSSENSETALKSLHGFCNEGDVVVLLSVGMPRHPLPSGMRPGRVIVGGSSVTSAGGGRAGVSRPDYPTYAETGDQLVQGQLAELEDFLVSKRKSLEDAGFEVEVVAELADDPAKAIVDVARRLSPSFVVMVRTAHPGVRERLFGTVARRVIEERVAPVMIVPD